MKSIDRFRIDDLLLVAIITISLMVFILRGCEGIEAVAQDNPLTPAVALGRLCISEAGWECWDTGDGLAIHEVILRGADQQDLRYTSFARSYARRLFGARPHDVQRLRWVGQLTPACAEPEAWPQTTTVRRGDIISVVPHAPWSAYRARCLSVFERAREVASEMTLDDADEWAICERPVHDWGGWMDRARAERIGLVPVSCGADTRNDFYCRPSLDPDCVEIDRD